MTQAQRGLLVLPGSPDLSGLLAPRVSGENPAHQATRVRLEMLEQMAIPAPLVLPARKVKRVQVELPEPPEK